MVDVSNECNSDGVRLCVGITTKKVMTSSNIAQRSEQKLAMIIDVSFSGHRVRLEGPNFEDVLLLSTQAKRLLIIAQLRHCRLWGLTRRTLVLLQCITNIMFKLSSIFRPIVSAYRGKRNNKIHSKQLVVRR